HSAIGGAAAGKKNRTWKNLKQIFTAERALLWQLNDLNFRNGHLEGVPECLNQLKHCLWECRMSHTAWTDPVRIGLCKEAELYWELRRGRRIGSDTSEDNKLRYDEESASRDDQYLAFVLLLNSGLMSPPQPSLSHVVSRMGSPAPPGFRPEQVLQAVYLFIYYFGVLFGVKRMGRRQQQQPQQQQVCLTCLHGEEWCFNCGEAWYVSPGTDQGEEDEDGKEELEEAATATAEGRRPGLHRG
ncbi:UNVERIFIED_CONTAM: hypothetical protein FKN15_034118, partial [Acipenser sinensis]